MCSKPTTHFSKVSDETIFSCSGYVNQLNYRISDFYNYEETFQAGLLRVKGMGVVFWTILLKNLIWHQSWQKIILAISASLITI